MTAIYEKRGLRFMYPENWKLSEGPELDMPYQVSVETPAGGLWSVNVFPPELAIDELLEEAIGGLQETYEDLEFAKSNFEFDGFVSRGVDAYFYCLDFMVMAHLQVVETSRFKLVFHFQAESRDFETQLNVFRAMALSLLQSL